MTCCFLISSCHRKDELTTINKIIINRGEWLWSPANIKRANKDAKIYVGRSTTVHNLLFCVHTLCMSNVTKTFLLVSSSVSSKQLLCFVHGQGQKREQKHRTKNEFHNHSPPLTMVRSMRKRTDTVVPKAPTSLNQQLPRKSTFLDLCKHNKVKSSFWHSIIGF